MSPDLTVLEHISNEMVSSVPLRPLLSAKAGCQREALDRPRLEPDDCFK